MKSTMGDDLPLTVTSILRHGATWHGDREVVTAEDEPGGGHPETGAAVPYDGRSIGELELRGPWITASYLSEADPGKFHDGWLRTGDIGIMLAASAA